MLGSGTFVQSNLEIIREGFFGRSEETFCAKVLPVGVRWKWGSKLEQGSI